MPRGLGKAQRHFLLILIHPPEALQEPPWLGILHGLDLYPCFLLVSLLCSSILDGPDFCSGIMLGPDLCSGILHDL